MDELLRECSALAAGLREPISCNDVFAAGANLMLSGHTHAGQIWPFNFLVWIKYPLLAGRYEVNGMTLIVCRGAGTWGPPMRLWQPSEMLRIKLRTSHSTTMRAA